MINFLARSFASGYTFLEAPRWHQGHLWVSDFFTRRVLKLDLEGNAEVMAVVDGMPSGLGFMPDGTPLVVSQMTHQIFRIRSGGKLELHADLRGISACATNDMIVDARGYAYVGNWGFRLGVEPPRPTKLALVTPEGKVRVAAEDLLFPNGCAITPDGRRLILAESFASRLTVFDIAADGSLVNRRVWAQLDKRYTPDGICLDARGMLWVGNPLVSEFIHVCEGGQIVDVLPTPQRWAVACVLGGADRRTLFALTAETSMEDQPKGVSKAFIETINVDTEGAGIP